MLNVIKEKLMEYNLACIIKYATTYYDKGIYI